MIFALTGCTVGPDYTRPDVSLPAHFAGAPAMPNATAGPSPALDRWWDGFDDPVLTGIIGQVIRQNLDIQAAQARVRQSRAMAREAGTAYLPQGSLDGDLVRQRQSLLSPDGVIASQFPGYTRDQTIQQVDAGASWELDLAGGLHRRARAYLDVAQAAEAAHAGVRISMAAEAADAYFQIRGLNTRIGLLETQIVTDQQLVRLVGDQVSAGTATDRDENDAQATLAADRVDLATLRDQRTAQDDRLDVLAGAPAGTNHFHLGASGEGSETVPAIPSDMRPAELLRRRPDVVAAERRLAAATENVGVAMSQYYPSISLAGLLGFDRLGSGTLFESAAFQPALLAGIHWRLFDFGKVDAEVTGARGAQAEALSAYRQEILQATEDVEDALSGLAKTDAQTAQWQRIIESQRQSRQSIERSFQAGASSMVDVCKRQRDLLIAERTGAANQSDRARATVQVFRALGGGWPPQQPPAAMQRVVASPSLTARRLPSPDTP
jgi:NodT family efflux transporter outer membrane factor (OMF) lipoprotein